MEGIFFRYPSSPPPFIVSFLRSYMDWKSLLHHNVSHSFDVSITIIWGMKCYVSTRSGVIRISSGTKPNSGVTIVAVHFLISNITNALEWWLKVPTALKPSLLQFCCNEPCAPINFFHSLRPSDVARYVPSAISECRELACLLMTINLSCPLIFIPRQILEKGVFQ